MVLSVRRGFPVYGSGGYGTAERWYAIRSRDATPGTLPLILGLHGAGGDERFAESSQNPGTARMYRQLAQMGYFVMFPDYLGAHTWGNDASIDQAKAAADYARASLGAKAGAYAVTGGSMGNLAMWNLIRRHPTEPIVAAVGFAGGSSLAYHASGNDNPVGKYQTEIYAAYTNQAGYDAAKATHDPLLFAGGLADPPPYMAFHDFAGDAAAPVEHVQTLAGLVGGSVVDIGQGGHGVSNYVTAEQVDDFLRPLLAA